MTNDTQHPIELPVWARDDAFPEAMAGWGWVDTKGTRHGCDSLEILIEAIRTDRKGSVILAWTPRQPRMILPEEVEGAGEAVFAARQRRSLDDLENTKDKLRWFSGLLVCALTYMIYQGWMSAPRSATTDERFWFTERALVHSMPVGVALLMFLIFAFIPWYQARKRLRELNHWNEGDHHALVAILRFETWLENQKSPITRFLLALIVLVGAVQLLPGDSLAAAGLDKARYTSNSEWWRLLTAPFLHGNLIHFLMNTSALLYLGKRVEVFARWPHVPMVFLFAAAVGGEASARFLTNLSVGASGGLMGWLGFLLVFELLHHKLVPRAATRRLLGGILLTGVIGLVGYRFIDNAAHIGGLLAGMLYALIVFPPSASATRPHATLTDRAAGGIALLVLVAAAALAAWKISHG